MKSETLETVSEIVASELKIATAQISESISLGAVVDAGAVVTKNVEPWTVVGAARLS